MPSSGYIHPIEGASPLGAFASSAAQGLNYMYDLAEKSEKLKTMQAQREQSADYMAWYKEWQATHGGNPPGMPSTTDYPEPSSGSDTGGGGGGGAGGGGGGAYGPAGYGGGSKAMYTPDEIAAAAVKNGLDPVLVNTLVGIESSHGANTSNPKSPSNTGLFQMAKYNEPGGAGDTRENQLQVGLDALKKTKADLENRLGRTAEPWEIYLAHQQGPGGAAALIANPNTPAGQVISNVTNGREGGLNISNNGGNPNAPASQFVDYWKNRFAHFANPYVDASKKTPNWGTPQPVAATPPAQPPAAEPAPSAGGYALPPGLERLNPWSPEFRAPGTAPPTTTASADTTSTMPIAASPSNYAPGTPGAAANAHFGSGPSVPLVGPQTSALPTAEPAAVGSIAGPDIAPAPGTPGGQQTGTATSSTQPVRNPATGKIEQRPRPTALVLPTAAPQNLVAALGLPPSDHRYSDNGLFPRGILA